MLPETDKDSAIFSAWWCSTSLCRD